MNVSTASLDHSRREISPLTIAGFIFLIALPAALVPREIVLLSVFLFAGAHNWMEVRYFLTRLPSRWGKSRAFFLTGIGGAVLLGCVSLGLQWISATKSLGAVESWTLAAQWNAAFIFWVGCLTALHIRRKRKSIFLVVLAGAAAWGSMYLPVFWFGLALVYLHPLVALIYLDLDLRRRRPQWRPIYRRGLLAVFPASALIFWLQWGTGPVSSADPMIWRLALQTGAADLAESPRALIGFHGFIQLLHYAVWLIAVPLIGLKSVPVTLRQIPMAFRNQFSKITMVVLLVGSTFLLFALWGGFLVNFSLTWDVYFAVAIFHVLVEFPFLIRNL